MSILKRPGWANYEIIEEGRLHNDKLKERIGKMFDRLSLGYSPNHVIDKISRTIRNEHGDNLDLNKITDDYIINIANSDYITKGKFVPSLRPNFIDQQQNTIYQSQSQSNPQIQDTSINFQTQAPPSEALPVGLPSEDSEEDNTEETKPLESEDAESTIDPEELKTFLQGVSDKDLHEYKSIWDKKDPNGIECQTINQEIQKRQQKEDAEEIETSDEVEEDSVFTSEIPKENLKRIEANTPKNTERYNESVKLSSKAVKELLQENYSKKKQHNFRIEQKYYGI